MLHARERLLEAWRQRIHPAASRQQVAIAFALLAGGAVLAVLGVLVVSLGDAVLARPSWIREVGFIAAAGGLPVFLTGLIAGLPTRGWIAGLGLVGLAGSVAGVGIFSALYPQDWFLQVRAPNTYAIGSYLIGVSLQAAAASASVASSFVERHGSDQPQPEGPPEVSDEEVAGDLAWAARQDWSWGGIPNSQSGIEIQLRDDDPDRATFLGGGAQVQREVLTAEDTARAASRLSGMRGKQSQRTEGAVSDQASRLRDLKREAEAGGARDRSFWWKLRHPLRWLRQG